MKLMLKAIAHPNGDLVLCGEAKTLLFRALHDVRANAALQQDASLLRTLDALQGVLGEPEGPLPSAKELLGDPDRERVARNLLRF